MEKYPEFPEPDSVSNEAEAATIIRGLRILARIIARDIMNNQPDANKDKGTVENKPRNRLTNNEGLY